MLFRSAGRIKDIATIIQRKYEHEVLGSCLKAMNFDPGVYFDAKGYAKGIHALPEGARRGVGLEAKIVDGSLVYLPVFPSPEKARDSLAKMFGMNKDRMELTGKDGAPVAVSVTDDAARLEQLRTKFQGGMSGQVRSPA